MFPPIESPQAIVFVAITISFLFYSTVQSVLETTCAETAVPSQLNSIVSGVTCNVGSPADCVNVQVAF